MSHEGIGKSDEWYTPKYVFDALECRFDSDVCAPIMSDFICTPTSHFITADSLFHEWKGFVWMNAPFGGRNGIVPWLNKLADHGNGIALTPDRTSAPWWQDICDKADAHLQVRNKIKFIDPNGDMGKQPSTGTTLFAFGEEAVTALINAEKNKLGLVFIRPKK
jgi:hypothetical protein